MVRPFGGEVAAAGLFDDAGVAAGASGAVEVSGLHEFRVETSANGIDLILLVRGEKPRCHGHGGGRF